MRVATKTKRCSVCGDRCPTNVRLKWRRDRDGLVFNICLACAEKRGAVNENSVENYHNTVQ